eukprot:6328985-Prymnesium_polylepis.1
MLAISRCGESDRLRLSGDCLNDDDDDDDDSRRLRRQSFQTGSLSSGGSAGSARRLIDRRRDDRSPRTDERSPRTDERSAMPEMNARTEPRVSSSHSNSSALGATTAAALIDRISEMAPSFSLARSFEPRITWSSREA